MGRLRADDRRATDKRREAKIKEEYKRIAKEEGKDAANRYSNRMRYERGLRNYVRASEMTSPAPQGHFLQEFGDIQSVTCHVPIVVAVSGRTRQELVAFFAQRQCCTFVDTIRDVAQRRDHRVDRV